MKKSVPGRQDSDSQPFWALKEDILPFLHKGVVSDIRMRTIDKNAQALGVSALQLMETAGSALAKHIRSKNGDKILFLCGSGNNGGDGMAAARHLHREKDVIVCYYDSPRMSDLTKIQLTALSSCMVQTVPFRCRDDLVSCPDIFAYPDIIVDALLGIGSQGEIREPIYTCVSLAMQSGKRIISVDVPTTGINPESVCAFHLPKMDGSDVYDIGIPVTAEICTGPGDLLMLRQRDPGVHKGVGGDILVIGGGPYQGAPYLCGLAALRAGADIVRIYSPVTLPEPDLIHIPSKGLRLSDEDVEPLIHFCKKADVVICGPGLGRESHELVENISPSCRKAVFDADALRTPLPIADETIYTPHAGEYIRMTGKMPGDDPVTRAKNILQSGLPGTVLLKGHVDVICDGRHSRFNCTGDPAMSVGGTGDILAGVCGALLKTLSPFDAACLGAYATGLAGSEAAAQYGYGMTARDILPLIPQVLFRQTDYET